MAQLVTGMVTCRWGAGRPRAPRRTPSEQLRLTVAARRETAAKLIEAGMSQREAAKALGVGQTQIRRDLTPNGSQTSQKGSTKAERRVQREFELELGYSRGFTHLANYLPPATSPLAVHMGAALPPSWGLFTGNRGV